MEYILLFAVVISIALAIFNNPKFKDIFGRNGKISKSYKDQVEFSYRHGFSKAQALENVNYSNGQHESYNGRFFSAKDGYPQ